MSRLIDLGIRIIAKFHGKLLSINDHSGLALNDKQLHFLIIGIFGFGLLLVLQPIFEWLFKHNAILLVTFIYVFSIVLVITFAIEIGQGFSGSGDMDFHDLLAGVLGFFAFFAIYLVYYLGFRKRIKENENKEG